MNSPLSNRYIDGDYCIILVLDKPSWAWRAEQIDRENDCSL